MWPIQPHLHFLISVSVGEAVFTSLESRHSSNVDTASPVAALPVKGIVGTVVRLVGQTLDWFARRQTGWPDVSTR